MSARTRDLLFELGCEELPPRSLLALSQALEKGFLEGLDTAGVAHGAARSFATPRRLAVLIANCAARAVDRHVERRGPPIAAAFDAQGTSTQAANAFAKSCGVDVAELERVTTAKGSWLVHRSLAPGAPTADVIGACLPRILAALPIARRMRWGDDSVEFVRPVRHAVLLWGSEVWPLHVLGCATGRITTGHRFHAPGPITLRSASSYENRLREAHVVASFAERRARIEAGVAEAAAGAGGHALIDAALLDEVTALVEWPVPILGRFESRFLALPREVVIATIQDHQRYFPVEKDGVLSGDFVTVSNLASRNPGVVREGNERVVRPRLSDAAFFWDQDSKSSLDAHAAKLAEVTFQSRLGSYADKVVRMVALARRIAQCISATSSAIDVAALAHIERSVLLAKADLVTAMVGEFPELQGVMGRYYAEAQGEPVEVARAIGEHYQPRFSGDAIPVTLAGRVVALADKLDTLAGIFAIDQKPSGAKDPFGLRRCALGTLRILLDGGLDIDLHEVLSEAAGLQPVQREGVAEEVYDFILERLRGLLLEKDASLTVEMIDAVLVGRPHSPLDALARLRALATFLPLPEATILAALNKRIGNILRKGRSGSEDVNPDLFVDASEHALHRAIEERRTPHRIALSEGRYEDALTSTVGLAAVVDRFFDDVMVMDEDLQRRENRLALLGDVRDLLSGVADLSRLPG